MNEFILDANILIRLLTGEPQPLAERVRTLLEAAAGRGLTLLVAPITVVEVVYVLGSFYGWSRADVVDGLFDLFASSPLIFLERDVLQQALHWFREIRQVQLPDAYAAALAVARGHGNVMTLDRDFRRLAGITVIDDPSQLQTQGS